MALTSARGLADNSCAGAVDKFHDTAMSFDVASKYGTWEWRGTPSPPSIRITTMIVSLSRSSTGKFSFGPSSLAMPLAASDCFEAMTDRMVQLFRLLLSDTYATTLSLQHDRFSTVLPCQIHRVAMYEPSASGPAVPPNANDSKVSGALGGAAWGGVHRARRHVLGVGPCHQLLGRAPRSRGEHVLFVAGGDARCDRHAERPAGARRRHSPAVVAVDAGFVDADIRHLHPRLGPA